MVSILSAQPMSMPLTFRQDSPRLDSGKARERGQGGAILDGFFRLYFSRKRVSQGPRNQTIRQGNLIIGS